MDITVNGDKLTGMDMSLKLLPDGNIETDKGFTFVKEFPLLALRQDLVPKKYTFQGTECTRIGSFNKKGGMQGHCIILADNGKFLFEGFFIDDKCHGPSRMIKLSQRKPGVTTIREGVYNENEAHGQFKQVKILPIAPENYKERPTRIETTFFTEGSCW